MKQIFREIWNEAMPYQDKRDDKGHAEKVLKYAWKLVKLEKADLDVVIPAAILHDIGWSKLSKKERFEIFSPEATEKSKHAARLKHQNKGVKMAEQILKRVNYNPKLIPEVLKIISQHDTREGFVSKNEGVMRDADKLWRYSRKGFIADIKRRKLPAKHLYEMRKSEINKPNYFYSKSAKKIALRKLNKRKKEFRI